MLTGSANLLGMKNVQDSLAGRLGVLELTPFSLRELNNNPQNLLDDLFDGAITQQTPTLNKPIIEQMLSGGYPEMQTLSDARLQKLWMGAYITKRHVKMPKLFFMDTGVLCNMLQVNLDSFWHSPYRGLITENFVFANNFRATIGVVIKLRLTS